MIDLQDPRTGGSSTSEPPSAADSLPPRLKGLPPQTPARAPRKGLGWGVKLAVVLLVLLAVGVVLVTNRLLGDRFTEVTRTRTELRLALYSGNLLSELQRTSVVPLLISSDPDLLQALQDGNYSRSSQRLMQVRDEIGVAGLQLVDATGRLVAATNRNLLGENRQNQPAVVNAKRQNETVFTAERRAQGGFDFTYSRAIRAEGQLLGVIIVGVDLMKYERAWTGLQDAVLVTDSEGTVVLATEPSWRGLPVEQALAARDAPSAIARALRDATYWAQTPADAYISGERVLKTEARVPFRGWRITAFTAYDSVRERVNGILALVIMGFAILLALTFYVLTRRAWSQSDSYRRESVELRALANRLQREIAEREKAQQNLAAAERTLAQSSKLAALGEMSAAVSHELNQPLAAMKTYLAGARLLLERRRPAEALSSFQRIDDLIDRMGAITRQLKSYARKGGEAFEPVDLRAAVSSALSMMEPQLKTRVVRITRSLPRQPVMVMADRIRLEQVIINLLRNALDATKDVAQPQIGIGLVLNGAARLTVRDNGHGIMDADNLFEPFYTTKKPGEGVGLGLAISTGIVTDLGGRLTARNLEPPEGPGAEFEMQLPLLGQVAAGTARVAE